VFINMTFMIAMEMSIVKVINVIGMANSGMPATRAMSVGVIVVNGMFMIHRKVSSCAGC
jgi:hypothetical protein